MIQLLLTVFILMHLTGANLVAKCRPKYWQILLEPAKMPDFSCFIYFSFEFNLCYVHKKRWNWL